ncbi:MAG TPA: VWA domain-containing protein [Granulicella sp.]|jgi:VWFA-related protein|nr:VWA domain-containing protein [Granulicella sp.]
MRPANLFAKKLAAVVPIALFLSMSATARSGAAQTASATSPAPPAVAEAGANKPNTLSVDARLVNLPVTVRDKKGALVQTLTKGDFSLQVDGHPQVIRYFDKDTNLPLTLGLLVDTSASQRNVIDDERAASSSFLDQMLTTDKDKAFVIQFSRDIELLQDVTSSRPKLQAALKEIDTPPPADGSYVSAPSPTGGSDSGSGSGSGSGNASDRRRAGTTLYDALFLASDELMSKQKGRKAVIILSDGDDRGSKETLARAIEAAQRADTIVYAIYFKGESPHQDNNMNRHPGGMGRGGGYPGGGYPGGGYPGGGYPGGGGGGYPRGGSQPSSAPRVDGKKILERMAHETGGRLFEVSKHETTAQIYTEIAEELRAQYRLGYTPDQATAADGYHQIDLAFTKPDDKKLTIQTREGYYTGK